METIIKFKCDIPGLIEHNDYQIKFELDKCTFITKGDTSIRELYGKIVDMKYIGESSIDNSKIFLINSKSYLRDRKLEKLLNE